MPRTTSLEKARTELADLGLALALEPKLNRLGEPDSFNLWVYSPTAVMAVAAVTKDNRYTNDNTVGMVLTFDQDEKFVAANYGHLYWDDMWLGEGEAAGWECRTQVSTWRPDEGTMKAALSFLKALSPVGMAAAAREAQEATQAAEKAAAERQANLAALNQAVLDNDDAASWASSVAYDAARTRRDVVSRLRSMADDMAKAADKLEASGRVSHLYFHPRSMFDIVEGLAKLEALEETVHGPLEAAIKERADRYGY